MSLEQTDSIWEFCLTWSLEELEHEYVGLVLFIHRRVCVCVRERELRRPLSYSTIVSYILSHCPCFLASSALKRVPPIGVQLFY